MSRLDETFEALRASKQTGLVAYVTAGDPDLARSRDVLVALGRAGADVIEVGVPFSDPIADGPVIQRASERALAAGSSLGAVLELVGSLNGDLDVPLVLFTYVNPVLRMGVETFIDRAATAGLAGVLILDLPIEESESMHAALGRRGIDQIFLISPTTTDVRIGEAARLGRGFLYAISRLGVTGARASLAHSARPLAARIRALTPLPIAFGFGISRPEHVHEVAGFADAAVVGSALVEVIAEAALKGEDPAAEAGRFVRWLKGN